MRRLVKKRTRKTFVYLTLIIGFFVFIFAFLFAAKYFFPNILKQDEKIISPWGNIPKTYDFEKRMKAENIDFSDIKPSSSSSYFIVELKNGIIVYFTDKKNVDTQVRSLHDILTRLTIDGMSQKDFGAKVPRIIDFRFDRPIVRF